MRFFMLRIELLLCTAHMCLANVGIDLSEWLFKKSCSLGDGSLLRSKYAAEDLHKLLLERKAEE